MASVVTPEWIQAVAMVISGAVWIFTKVPTQFQDSKQLMKDQLGVFSLGTPWYERWFYRAWARFFGGLVNFKGRLLTLGNRYQSDWSRKDLKP